VSESFPPVAARSDEEGRGPGAAPDPDFWGPPRNVPRPSPRGRARGGGGRDRAVVSGRLTDGLRGRLHEWRSDGRIGMAVLVVVALVAGLIFYKVGGGTGDAGASPAPASAVRPRRRAPTTTTTTVTTGPAAPDASAASPAARVGGPRVVVHVAGAVTTPGVVDLARGTRVIDAIEAAGGALPNADLDRLNLAAKVVDGERVLVQHVGDPPAPADPAAGADAASGATPAGPLNLNTATQAQLELLPGIGPALAQGILAERAKKGGFRSVNELREVHGIGERRFADLAPLVTV
jgi:competence protein ComEA